MGKLLVFDYCSPECRDMHLLKDHKTILMMTLEELKNELQEKVVSDAVQMRGLTTTHSKTLPTNGRPSTSVDPPQATSKKSSTSSSSVPIACSSDGSVSRATNNFVDTHTFDGSRTKNIDDEDRAHGVENISSRKHDDLGKLLIIYSMIMETSIMR